MLFTTVLSQWDLSYGTFGLLSPGKSSCDGLALLPNLRCMLGCFSVSIDYRIFNVRIDVHACTRGCTDTVRESALKEKNPLPHRGIEPVLAACQTDALPTELHPHPDVSDFDTLSWEQRLFHRENYSLVAGRYVLSLGLVHRLVTVGRTLRQAGATYPGN